MRHVPHCSCPLTHSGSPAWMDVSSSLIRVFRHPDEHLLAEGARSGPRQDVKGIEDLDGIAPRWATTGSADQTTNFGGSPVTNADRRSVNMIWAGGEDSSATNRTELSKIQSIRSQTGRRHGPTVPQYWRLVRWLLSCSSARMDHRELRTRIRLLMASGELPPDAPLSVTLITRAIEQCPA